MKNQSITVQNVLAELTAGPRIIIVLAGLASAVHAASIEPFASAEATYTDSGNKFKGSPWAPNGYELGAGLTFGVRIDTRHELSLSTGYTKWEGDHQIIPGVVNSYSEAEQIPVLLNYRYRLPIDSKGRFTVFAGPTLGVIHEKALHNNIDLGGVPPGFAGETSDSAWRFAVGGTVGFDAKLSDRWTAGLSAQLLHVAEHTYSEYGGLAKTTYEAATRPSFALTAGYSW